MDTEIKNNKDLYESKEVVAKYTSHSTRARSLNNAEKDLIDRFDIRNKKILVLGSGAGRVPINLILFGNEVLGIDRSEALLKFAQKTFPKSKFSTLDFIQGDMCDLSSVSDESFDVVIFPMNSIDYVEGLEMRRKAIAEAGGKLKKGGIFALSSHNKLGYIISPKVPIKSKRFKYLLEDYIFDKEEVVGGGTVFKGNPDFVINEIEKINNFKFVGFTVDARNKLDRFLAQKLNVAKYIFPYIFYVFQK